MVMKDVIRIRAGRIEAEELLRGDVRPAAVLALLLVLFGGLLPNPWQWWWPCC